MIRRYSFFGVDAQLYDNFKDYGIGVIHSILAKILSLLLVMHVAGVISYQIVYKTISNQYLTALQASSIKPCKN